MPADLMALLVGGWLAEAGRGHQQQERRRPGHGGRRQRSAAPPAQRRVAWQRTDPPGGVALPLHVAPAEVVALLDEQHFAGWTMTLDSAGPLGLPRAALMPLEESVGPSHLTVSPYYRFCGDTARAADRKASSGFVQTPAPWSRRVQAAVV